MTLSLGEGEGDREWAGEPEKSDEGGKKDRKERAYRFLVWRSRKAWQGRGTGGGKAAGGMGR